jgi:signal transduction histidine kinase
MRNPAAVARPAADNHVWDRTKVGWHVAFMVFAVVAAALVAADDEAPGWRRVTTLVLLACLCVWYAGTGARVLHEEPHRRLGLVYVAVAGPVTVVMFAVMPATSVMLFGLYPQIWSLLPAGRAVVTTAATTLSVGAVVVVFGGFGDNALGEAVIIVVVGLLLALLLGLWITKIIDQSRDRARLVSELAAARTELAAANHEAGVLAERQRLARDLHDTLAQGSTSVLFLLQAARTTLHGDAARCERHLVLAEQTTRENIAEIRALVAALTPTAFEGASLPVALERLTGRIGQELGIRNTMTTTGTHRRLPASCEVVLLRVAQEALANVRKHAQATAVTIELGYHDDRVTLRVTDDGRGFDPDTRTANGFGLDGLRDRVRASDGDLTVDTAPGAGVAVLVSLPAGMEAGDRR